MLRRLEKSSGSASTAWGDAWCFLGEGAGEALVSTGEILEAECEGGDTILSTLSLGRLELRAQ